MPEFFPLELQKEALPACGRLDVLGSSRWEQTSSKYFWKLMYKYHNYLAPWVDNLERCVLHHFSDFSLRIKHQSPTGNWLDY